MYCRYLDSCFHNVSALENLSVSCHCTETRFVPFSPQATISGRIQSLVSVILTDSSWSLSLTLLDAKYREERKPTEYFIRF